MSRPINDHNRVLSNVTVTPMNFTEPVSFLKSPRNSSKTKIKLVSPSVKPQGSRISSKENKGPKSPVKGDSFSRTASGGIELGGKSGGSFWDRSSYREPEQNGYQSCTVGFFKQHSRENSRDSLRRESSKQRSVVIRHEEKMQSPPVPVQRATSPQRIYINQRPVSTYQTPTIQTAPKVVFSQPIQVKPIPPLASSSKKSLQSIPKSSKNIIPTDLVIQEEKTLEYLKESYQGEMQEIQKLKEEIANNNQEIKSLIKNSKTEKQSSKDKHESREPSIWDEEEADQRSKGRQNMISKRTLINDLKIQTVNQLDRRNDQASVQTDTVLPQEAQEQCKNSPLSSQHSIPKTQRLSLTKNNECQVQMVLSVHQSKQTTPLKPSQTESRLKQSIIHEAQNSLQQSRKTNLKGFNSADSFEKMAALEQQMAASRQSLANISRVTKKSLKKEDLYVQEVASLEKIQIIQEKALAATPTAKFYQGVQSSSPVPVSQNQLKEQTISKAAAVPATKQSRKINNSIYL